MFRRLFRTIAPARASFKSEAIFPESEFPRTKTGYALLICPLTAFGLGCWQVQRRTWKENLILDLERRTSQEPVELPEDLRKVDDLAYCKVKVRGTFDHAEELYIGPRSDKHSQRSGYYVVTPLKLSDRDYSILVNRGWVPRTKTNPATRSEGQTSGEVEIVGIVRLDERGASDGRSGDMFASRNITLMAQTVNSSPVFLDAVKDCSVPGGPVGGQTKIELRNDHLSYIVTWFSLSAATFYMWYQRYGRRIPRIH